MSFDVGADAYARFMGRYSEPLAAEFVALLDVQDGDRALDVGCGPGALTAQLVAGLGTAAVSAIDPSEPFVAAVRARLPDVDCQLAVAEQLPYADDTFDVTMAQLVVHFLSDPRAGLSEMARVTRPGGTVAACVWDHAGERSPLSIFWRAVRELDPAAHDESELAGARDGHLVALFERTGLTDVRADVLSVQHSFATFDEWWEPYTLGVGPAGAYLATLDLARGEDLRRRCLEAIPATPFVVTASAWTAAGTA